ncbi:conserved hypothetical protein [Capnocytophaga canis]|uniref:Nucleotide-diphospho-sugar transferase n=1 Tax=Capnocytophaga canis TaxID=1848903 RepID=A0A0B7HZX3_9FLAO|nr:hypothetical protein [Capnocytophaga canis]CEN43422.1 conserved hypothetical protein [Capnocytophaga canis]CEN44381.1 conserved hypothetical protein [Capnocytophaga canis]
MNFRTPILFLIFNRPDTTLRVFEEIKKIKPSYLYVACDGARKEREGEEERVKNTRDVVIKNIDWECEVKTLFREENLGCREAVSSAITWFFDNEEMGIILEDDCLPSQSFFPFCEELLSRYRDDTRVWLVGGTNFLSEVTSKNEESYYFSKYDRSWGWASWRRAWENYDKEMKNWPKIKKEKYLENILYSKKEADIFTREFDAVYEGKIDTWDYQWLYTILINSGKSIIPNVNLISNIGFGDNATHTFDSEHPYANLKRGEIKFPLVHPTYVVENFQNDILWSNTLVRQKKNALRIVLEMIQKGRIIDIFKKIIRKLK